MITWLEAVHGLLAAVPTPSDRATRLELVACARARLEKAKAEVASAELLVVASERELARRCMQCQHRNRRCRNCRRRFHAREDRKAA